MSPFRRVGQASSAPAYLHLYFVALTLLAGEEAIGLGVINELLFGGVLSQLPTQTKGNVCCMAKCHRTVMGERLGDRLLARFDTFHKILHMTWRHSCAIKLLSGVLRKWLGF